MRRRLPIRASALALASILVAGTPVASQSTTTGTLRGTVTDTTGGILPGVVVAAISDALVPRELIAITNAKGNYRFPSLPPGLYTLEAELDGFVTVRRENVRLGLGQSLDVDFQLGEPTTSDEILVLAEALGLSTVSNNVGFHLDQSFLGHQPLPREPIELMDYAPGVQDAQAYGAPSEAANAYNLDGVDVSDPALGTQWVFPSVDWILEIQVTGLGADAEYGGFTGAVLNMITKSGGNELAGDLRLYWSGGDLNSENAPPGTEGVNKIDTDLDTSLSAGGKILRDKLWFFASGNERARVSDPFFSEGAPPHDLHDTEREWSRYLGKLTYQADESDRLVFLADYDAAEEDYRGVGELTLASAGAIQDSPSWSYNVTWESLVSDANFFTLKATGFVGRDDRFARNGALANRFDAESGFFWQNLDFSADFDKERLTSEFAWNLYADGLLVAEDAHNFKFGLLYEELDDDQVTHRTAGFSYFDDSFFCDSIEGYFADPSCALSSSDRGGEMTIHAEMEGLHAYAQDSFQVGRLSLNSGLRYSRYQGGFRHGGGDVYDVDMLAPRLGVVWDVRGDGRTALKAHWGHYYEGMAIVFFDRELSGAAMSDLEFWDYDFETGEFDLFAGRRVQGGAGVDPGIDHPRVEQYVATFEHRFGRNMLFGLDYVHRDHRDVAAMVTANVADYEPLVAPGNPLGGGDLPFFDLLAEPEFVLTNPEGAYRDYDALMVRFRRPYDQGWSVDASLVVSDVEGNADFGLVSYVDEFADLNGLVNAEGKLPSNSEWMLKVTGSVDLPGGLVLAGHYRFRSGEHWTPWVRVRGLLENDRQRVLLTPRGSEQYEDRGTLDLHLEKTFELGAETGLAVIVDAFNVFDSDEVTAGSTRWGDYHYEAHAHPDGSVWSPASSYREPLAIQTPRRIRLGLRLSF